MKTNKIKLFGWVGLATLLTAAGGIVTWDDVSKFIEARNLLKIQTHPFLEKREEGESEHILSTVKNMFLIQMASAPAKRDAHSKGHACVIADFEVAKNIPADLQIGLLSKTGRNFEAIIRYSNGSGGQPKADQIPDGHGMAIKVLSASRTNNLLADGKSQDFLMINSPHFFVRSSKDYSLMQQIAVQDKKVDRFFAHRAIREALAQVGHTDAEELSEETVIRPMVSGLSLLSSNPMEYKTLLDQLFPNSPNNMDLMQVIGGKIQALTTPPEQIVTNPNLFNLLPLERKIAFAIVHPVQSMLAESYFSMSSYLLKSATRRSKDDMAVKYIARPVACKNNATIPAPQTPTASENYLREDLVQRLSDSDYCYNFYIQVLPKDLSIDIKKKLVEDPRLDFKTTAGTIPQEILVAQIKMRSQQMDTPELQTACENLSFNPWHTTAEHRPLGALNRARKVAVTVSSFRRHLVLGTESVEPKTIKQYLNSAH